PPPASHPFPYTTLFRSQRIIAKEEELAKKLDQLERRLTESATKERDLAARETAFGAKEGRLASALEDQKRKLEAIAGLTAEEAKDRKSTRLNSSHLGIS